MEKSEFHKSTLITVFCYTASWNCIYITVNNFTGGGGVPRNTKGCNEKLLIHQVQKTKRSNLIWQITISKQSTDKINKKYKTDEKSVLVIGNTFFITLGLI